jgi:K+-sensing histidine kinase KdpD
MTEGENNAALNSPIETRRLIVAVVFLLAACGLQWLFGTAIQPYVWFLFYPAVFSSSWIGDLRGGLAVTVLSSGLVWYFFIPPHFLFAVQRPMNLVSIAIFMGISLQLVKLVIEFHGGRIWVESEGPGKGACF